MTQYTIKHHCGFDCGYKHETLTVAIKCLRKQMKLTRFTCCKCKAQRLGYRIAKCRECGHKDMFTEIPFDTDYMKILATDDGGRSWRCLDGNEQHELAQIIHNVPYRK